VLVFDGDAAGGAATERSIGLFLDAGMRVRVVTLPEGEDPDSFLRQHTGEEFLGYVDEAVGFVDYLLTRAARFADLRSPTGRADCVDRLAPLLRKIENQVERWGYMALVAERLRIPRDVLEQKIEPRQAPQGRPLYQSSARSERPLSVTRVSPEYTLLETIYAANDLRLLDRVQHQLTLEDFHNAHHRAIYTIFLRLASQGEVAISPHVIDEGTSPEQQELLGKMATAPVLSSQAEIAKALDDCVTKMRQRRFKEERQRILEQLKTAGDSPVEQQQLLQELDTLSKKQLIGSS
jgi:DNA primase